MRFRKQPAPAPVAETADGPAPTEAEERAEQVGQFILSPEERTVIQRRLADALSERIYSTVPLTRRTFSPRPLAPPPTSWAMSRR